MRVFNFGLKMLACVAILSMATVANADTWDEIGNGGGDAGAFPDGDFQSVAMGDATVYDVITGDNSDGIDAYKITVTDAANFFIEDQGGNDTQAFLWDLDGNPLFRNDDNPSGAFGFSFGFGDANTHTGGNVGVTTMFADGDQFIMSVGAFGDTAIGDGGTGDVFQGSAFSDIAGPSGENFVGWAAGGAGAYNIVMSGAVMAQKESIPEPTSLGFLAIGLVGLVSRRRK